MKNNFKRILFLMGLILVGCVIKACLLSKENFAGETTFTTDQVKNALKNVKGTPGPRGLRGSRGPTGKEGHRGEAGGTNIDNGPLRNVEYNNMVLDRRSGTSTQAFAYLSQQDNSQNQTWVLSSDGKLQNRFGVNQCLSGSEITGNVHMTSCNDTNNMKWHHNQFGQLELDNGTKEKLCLSVKKVGTLKGTPIIKNHKGNSSLTQNNVVQATLDTCDVNYPPNQQWSFY
jgi:hypothetical protein